MPLPSPEMNALPSPGRPAVPLALPAELAMEALTVALRDSGIVAAIEQAAELRLAEQALLDKEQMAAHLRIDIRTLEVWMRPAGDRGGRALPHLKIGPAVRFRLAAVEEWARQYEVNPVLRKVA